MTDVNNINVAVNGEAYSDSKLSEREQKVLEAVVMNHVQSGKPIGSRTMAKLFDFKLSPATLRNVMADLEEKGYLKHPHKSAGRIPTEVGYRYYINHLEQGSMIGQDEKRLIKDFFGEAENIEVKSLLTKIPEILSMLTNYMGIVFLPAHETFVLLHIECIRLNARKALLVMVPDTGIVQNRVIALDESITQDELNKISRFLNDHFAGMAFSEIRRRILSMMKQEKSMYDSLIKQALQVSKDAFKEEKKGELYVGGASNIVNQPEFADFNKLRDIFKAFEEKSKIVKILNECLIDREMNISIGSENTVPDLHEISFVTSTYKKESQVMGALGVVGPVRMPYPKIMSLVKYTAKTLSRFLSAD